MSCSRRRPATRRSQCWRWSCPCALCRCPAWCEPLPGHCIGLYAHVKENSHAVVAIVLLYVKHMFQAICACYMLQAQKVIDVERCSKLLLLSSGIHIHYGCLPLQLRYSNLHFRIDHRALPAHLTEGAGSCSSHQHNDKQSSKRRAGESARLLASYSCLYPTSYSLPWTLIAGAAGEGSFC